MKTSKEERAKAIEQLRAIVKPGDTVFAILRSVSRSGMSRSIDLYHFDEDGPRGISRLAAIACDFSWDKNRECIKMGGCGMDMGFAAVYDLSHVLYGEGFECIGRSEDRKTWCPSNDHSNGDRDYTPHHHRDGGYALNHRWM